MVKTKILNEFTKLKCITDYTKLEEYIDFCLLNDVGNKQSKKTTSHHILPQGKTLPFKEFSNLKENSWNKTELTYYNHYFAHYLLTQAINHYCTNSSFCAMHNKDLKNKRISFEDLIPKEEYDKIHFERNKMISEDRLQLLEYNGELMTKASYISRFRTSRDTQKKSARMKNNNIIHLPGVLEKMRKIKSQTFIDGKNIDTISAERAAATMKKEFILSDGTLTTTYKENGKKLSRFLNAEFIDENGNITTFANQRGLRQQQILRAKGKFYYLKNVFDNTINEFLSAVEIRNISPGLEKKSKENYLGKSKFGQTVLTEKGKENLIGLYVEEL